MTTYVVVLSFGNNYVHEINACTCSLNFIKVKITLLRNNTVFHFFIPLICMHYCSKQDCQEFLLYVLF